MPKLSRTKKPSKSKTSHHRGIDELHELGDEMMKHLKNAKREYSELDAQTKKKIAAGIVGATALLAGLAAHKAHRRKKK
ncbi:MAG: hypothetical protein COT81_02940 [Candidatus Buchananbacteria bacterium CG10_big_fil_rev_8_21_14_0_10_42_9]|uniref:Uncharacterized protein n=1 Tax=Candidatus Buchananbacteria bacterium CG10_big_fil_rev_8_21_14_0_10_42_9 TaxID=1974526 RepID=A0A2H0W171_9BACT|nr:MAG: hypothetical protein COT81_02940 [Candidatus Buchananbacteria bacterium CG10_big_fil_rev_8_21_14_0_10_42_9]